MKSNVIKEQEAFAEELEKVAPSHAYLINAKLNRTIAVEDVYQKKELTPFLGIKDSPVATVLS